jgi:hypothetical protein
MILASLALALVVGLLAAAIDDEIAVLLLLPFLCFVIGVIRVLYGVFFAEKRARRLKGDAPQPHAVPVTPGQLGAAARSPELSAPRGTPIRSFTTQRVETAEMVRPPSVTESTTRLFDGEADSHRA